jgi:hypothetical protein
MICATNILDEGSRIIRHTVFHWAACVLRGGARIIRLLSRTYGISRIVKSANFLVGECGQFIWDAAAVPLRIAPSETNSEFRATRCRSE